MAFAQPRCARKDIYGRLTPFVYFHPTDKTLSIISAKNLHRNNICAILNLGFANRLKYDIIKRMKKACIFDFDGVIIDSEKYHYLGWLRVAEEIGTTLTYEEYAPFKSAGRTVVIPYLFEKAGKTMSSDDMEKFVKIREEKIALEIVKLNEKDIMDGIVDFLKLLKKNNVPCAVASASASSTGVAKRFGLYDYFTAFVDGNDKLPRKPNPEIYLEAARRMGVEARDCIVFEDSIMGVTGAKNAKMYCVGFQTHFTDKADKIIDSFVGQDLTLLNV